MKDADTGIEKEIISFIPSYDKSKTKYMEIKYTLSNSTFKTQLPIFMEGSPEELLHFLYEFNQAKTKLGYSTYQKLDSGFEQILQGNARNEWNTIKTTVSPSVNTVDSFNEQISALKRIYIPEPSAIDNQKTYLHRIKKNDKLSVPHFLDRLKHIDMLILQFPDATPDNPFSPQEIKKLFYHTMPVRWRTNFINSGQSLQTTTTDLLQTYMVQQEQQTDAHCKKFRNQNKSTQAKGTGSLAGQLSYKTKKRSGQNQRQRENKKKRLNNDDDCPIHGNSHKWGQCHQNQYGDNFRPCRQNMSLTSYLEPAQVTTTDVDHHPKSKFMRHKLKPNKLHNHLTLKIQAPFIRIRTPVKDRLHPLIVTTIPINEIDTLVETHISTNVTTMILASNKISYLKERY